MLHAPNNPLKNNNRCYELTISQIIKCVLCIQCIVGPCYENGAKYLRTHNLAADRWIVSFLLLALRSLGSMSFHLFQCCSIFIDPDTICWSFFNCGRYSVDLRLFTNTWTIYETKRAQTLTKTFAQINSANSSDIWMSLKTKLQWKKTQVMDGLWNVHGFASGFGNCDNSLTSLCNKQNFINQVCFLALVIMLMTMANWQLENKVTWNL